MPFVLLGSLISCPLGQVCHANLFAWFVEKWLLRLENRSKSIYNVIEIRRGERQPYGALKTSFPTVDEWLWKPFLWEWEKIFAFFWRLNFFLGCVLLPFRASWTDVQLGGLFFWWADILLKEWGGYSLLFMGRVGKSASANLVACFFDVVRVFLVTVVWKSIR